MWCGECQQDVRGEASKSLGAIVCVRCSHKLSASYLKVDSKVDSSKPQEPQAQATQEIRVDPSSVSDGEEIVFRQLPAAADFSSTNSQLLGAPYASIDTTQWEIEQELKTVEHVLRTWKTTRTQSAGSLRFDMPRADMPRTDMPRADHAAVSEPQDATQSHFRVHPSHTPNESHSTGRTSEARASERPKQMGSWSLLLLGISTFVCGSTLLGWATYAGRTDLLPIALPMAVGGQLAMLIGLFFQFENLSTTHRTAQNSIAQLDEEICDLRQTTARIIHQSHQATSSVRPEVAPTETKLPIRSGDEARSTLEDLQNRIQRLSRELNDPAPSTLTSKSSSV